MVAVAALANVTNNLPAVLVLSPLAVTSGMAAVLAAKHRDDALSPRYPELPYLWNLRRGPRSRDDRL